MVHVLYFIPYFFGLSFASNAVFLKILGGMANSVDPDQNTPERAVWSGFALFVYAILLDTLVFKILGNLPYMFNIFQQICLDFHFYVFLFSKGNFYKFYLTFHSNYQLKWKLKPYFSTKEISHLLIFPEAC